MKVLAVGFGAIATLVAGAGGYILLESWDGGRSTEAQDCIKVLRAHLVSPSSLKIATVHDGTSSGGSGDDVVRIEYDASNAFNAMLRGTAICSFRRVSRPPGEIKSLAHFRAASVLLEGDNLVRVKRSVGISDSLDLEREQAKLEAERLRHEAIKDQQAGKQREEAARWREKLSVMQRACVDHIEREGTQLSDIFVVSENFAQQGRETAFSIQLTLFRPLAASSFATCRGLFSGERIAVTKVEEGHK